MNFKYMTNEQYKITKQEETAANTFIRIDADKPLYIERFIPNNKNLRDEIEDMVAELSIRYDEYVTPEVPVSKPEEDRETLKGTIRQAKVDAAKAKKLADREAKEEETKPKK